jgi:hypothetical protein
VVVPTGLCWADRPGGSRVNDLRTAPSMGDRMTRFV